jgi:hypothetical protein
MIELRCSACANPYHESTGHRHSDRTRLCGPCAREFAKWVKSHTRKHGKIDFYEHAAKSVRPAGDQR